MTGNLRQISFLALILLFAFLGFVLREMGVFSRSDSARHLSIERDATFLESIRRTPSIYSIDVGNKNLVAQGLQIYNQSCAVCHGANLEGQPNWQARLSTGLLPAPPHDDSGHTWHHPDELLFNIVKYGPGFNMPEYRSAMQGYADILTDEEIRAVNTFIASRWSNESLLIQSQGNARYEISKTQAGDSQ